MPSQPRHPRALFRTHPSASAKANSSVAPSPQIPSTLAQVEAELPQGYLEAEPEGLSFARLLCVYAVLLRETRHRLRQNLRTLFRPHPAH